MTNRMMDKYTIKCTEEQTLKAIELDAPIDYSTDGVCLYPNETPTAEQMINWLEEQGFSFDVYQPVHTWSYDVCHESQLRPIKEDNGLTSRKEATLEAIDAALEYLSKKENSYDTRRTESQSRCLYRSSL